MPQLFLILVRYLHRNQKNSTMTDAETQFHDIAANIPNATEGKMFGALCIKMQNGKAAAIFKNDKMVFKLTGTAQTEALQLEGTQVFDPMNGRPMNGWIEIPYQHADKWPQLANEACAYVATLEAKKK